MIGPGINWCIKWLNIYVELNKQTVTFKQTEKSEQSSVFIQTLYCGVNLKFST